MINFSPTDLILPAGITITIILCSEYSKNKYKYLIYIAIFTVILLAKIFSPFRLQASEVPYQCFKSVIPNHEERMDAKLKFMALMVFLESKEADLTPEQRKILIDNYKERRDFHFNSGISCFKQAQEICVLIPIAKDKEIADRLFLITISSFASNDLKSKMIIALLQALEYYGVEVIDNCRSLSELLAEAEFHFDMHEFFCKALRDRGVN